MMDQHITGGYDVEFCSELNEDYICCICHLAFRDPCQLDCGHQYCTSCLQSCKKTEDGHIECPQDREIVNMDKVFPDKAVARKVLSLTVKCKNVAANCDWTGDLRALEEHVKKCEFECICCSNEGCKSFYQRRFIQEHLSLNCIFRAVACCYCKDNYILKDKKDHLDKCVKVPIECDNKCGEVVPTNEMEEHLEMCPLAIVDCSYADVGCQYKCKRSIREIHEQEEMPSHLKCAMEKFCVLQNELRKQKKSSIERIEIVEKKWECQLKLAAREISGLKTDLEAHKISSRENICMLEDKLKQVDYIWLITDHNQRLNEERISGESMLGSPFFTSKYGYKMRLSAYLNGLGSVKGSYLSIFLQIMRGKYDAILKWPFSNKFKLSILHQGDEAKNVTYEGDPTITKFPDSFTRPTTECNLGVGCVKLISHIDIEHEGFLVEDNIFLKCEIKVTS